MFGITLANHNNRDQMKDIIIISHHSETHGHQNSYHPDISTPLYFIPLERTWHYYPCAGCSAEMTSKLWIRSTVEFRMCI